MSNDVINGGSFSSWLYQNVISDQGLIHNVEYVRGIESKAKDGIKKL